MASPLAQRVQQALRAFPGLDPRAVLAVASREGLGGGIGDNGTSFGPFQLHYGGAYPSFAPQGAGASQQWAWSPQGLNYALGQINGVAGGLTGNNAIANIVSRFERPANIPGEIAGAEGAYGSVPSQGPVGPSKPLGGAGSTPNPGTPLGGPPAPTPQQLAASRVSTLGRSFATQLAQSTQALLNGGTPNLGALFSLAKNFQEAKASLGAPKAPPLGGTALARGAALKA